MGIPDYIMNKANHQIGAIAKACIVIHDRTDKGGEEAATDREFFVQFNPTSLSFSGTSSNDRSQMKKVNATDSKLDTFHDSVSSADPRYTLSFHLIFDKVSNIEAFSPPGALLQVAKKYGIRAAGEAVDYITTSEKDHYNHSMSVQQQVELLICAIGGSKTKEVTFKWGMMAYRGTLSSVSAQYTMFHMDGTPVHAGMDISIVCNKNDMEQSLKKDYKATFKNMGIPPKELKEVTGIEAVAGVLKKEVTALASTTFQLPF